MTKKIFALMLGVIIGASHYTYIYAQDFSCGDNAKYSYENGVLTVYGTGKINDYNNGIDRPWDSFFNDVNKIVIDNGITEIGDWAFSDLKNLSEIQFGNTLQTIGERAFYNCSSITYISLPEGIQTIEDGAFNSCTSMVRVDLPESLTSIGNSSFMNLPQLSAVVIPSNVNSIGKWAFFGCSSLTGIYFEGKVPNEIGTYMISDINENYMIFVNTPYAAEWSEKNIFDPEHTYLYNTEDIIPIYLNNRRINFDQQPIIKDGRTLVPVRAIFEAMGAVVGWDEETRTVVAERNGIIIKISIDNTVMYKNDIPITIDVPAVIENSRTLVPARAISEAFGAQVSWDEASRTVNITIDD